jgi:hypothetical protein
MFAPPCCADMLACNHRERGSTHKMLSRFSRDKSAMDIRQRMVQLGASILIPAFHWPSPVWDLPAVRLDPLHQVRLERQQIEAAIMLELAAAVRHAARRPQVRRDLARVNRLVEQRAADEDRRPVRVFARRRLGEVGGGERRLCRERDAVAGWWGVVRVGLRGRRRVYAGVHQGALRAGAGEVGERLWLGEAGGMTWSAWEGWLGMGTSEGILGLVLRGERRVA